MNRFPSPTYRGPDTLDCAVVIPTIGRPGVQALISSLAVPPAPSEVIVVHDRPTTPLRLAVPGGLRARIVGGSGRGPAAARNVGWRLARTEWVAFLDDDVQIGPQWTYQLGADLARAVATGAAGVQGDLTVPLPVGRRPTDWERQVATLAGASWITADMAYRRDALTAVRGFDERFPRAFREDVELAIRMNSYGFRLLHGRRRATHPVGSADPWVSLRRQAGNADDALMRQLHGPQWRQLGGVTPGRRRLHALVSAAGAAAVVAWIAGGRRTAAALGAGWLAGTAEFATQRIVPGPRTPAEVVTMAMTSVAIPPLAVGHYLRGWLHHRGARPLPGPRVAARPVGVDA